MMLCSPWSALVLIAALAGLAGCEAQPRPDFLRRVAQDCRDGSVEACVLLQGMLTAEGSVAPRSFTRVPARRNQVERNADALMQGVDRARSAPRAPHMESSSGGEV